MSAQLVKLKIALKAAKADEKHSRGELTHAKKDFSTDSTPSAAAVLRTTTAAWSKHKIKLSALAERVAAA